jgi:alpha-mannosidase
VLGQPREGNYLPPRQSLLSVAGDHVVVTALKQTHEGQDLLLRLYETQGKPNTVNISADAEHNISHVSRSNLLEDTVEPLDSEEVKHIALRPWQIMSLRIAPSARGSEIDPNWKKNWKAAPVVEIKTSLGASK